MSPASNVDCSGPLVDIRNVTRLHRVVKDGVIFDAATLLADGGMALAVRMLRWQVTPPDALHLPLAATEAQATADTIVMTWDAIVER